MNIRIARFLFAACILCFGCTSRESNISDFDGWIFERSGTFPFGRAPIKTLKDVHLEGGGLLNAMVVVEGQVEKAGAHQTYLIFSDPNARLLVELTSYYELPMGELFVPQDKLRVLGRIKTGRKGLPYLSAYAIKKIPQKSQ